ncbi:hypothetical protein HY480_01775 [Candidatus Uhrbacteria bacterium]|nr:hypothetical protein [Candidatus Uhrbacteria bacterium]
MRTRIIAAALAAIALGAATCRKQPEPERVDVINGIAPVDTLPAQQQRLLDSLRVIPPEQRGAFVARELPGLDERIAAHLVRSGRITRADSVVFLYGSVDSVRAEDANGVVHAGFFAYQLIAKVFASGLREPIFVGVACSNGMFDILDSRLQRVTSAVPLLAFVIRRGEGLEHYLGHWESIDFAERHSLPLFARRIGGRRVTAEWARAHLGSVKVLVQPGDSVDMVADTYTPARGRRRAGGI